MMPLHPIVYRFLTIASFLLIFVCISCEDVIEVDLENGNAELVVDAEILWIDGTAGENQFIYLSRLTDFYNEETTKVSNARVTIKNEAGTPFIFSETETPGTYVCTNFIPEIEKEYRLEIIVDDETYTATETMVASPQINRVEQYEDGGFFGDENQLSIFYNDPADEKNYYLTKFHAEFLQFSRYELTDDDLFNGNEIEESFSDEDLDSGDVITITFRGVSEQFYNYVELIMETTYANPFGTPPSNIRGNVINETNPDNPAFGYFRLSEARSLQYTMQ